MTWTEQERRAWAFPPIEGMVDGIDLAFLDPADPDDRGLLIRCEHTEFEAALKAGLEEIDVEGEAMNPRFHLVIHEVVANQIWDGEPPETADTVRRLDRLGYNRHEVFHMIGSVVSEQIRLAMLGDQTADVGWTRQQLAALPGSWETQRGR